MNDTNIISIMNNNDTTAIEGVVDVVAVVVETTNTSNESLVSESSDELSDVFKWTWVTILQSIVVFFLAGVAEIIGGWMVWQAVRGDGGEKDTSNNTNKKPPWWYAVIGSIVLIIYGFIPVFQPTSNFGRIYAVYGGVFIVLSYAFGWLLDGTKPDIGDISGGSIALIGVCIAMFWPRS